MRCFFCAFHCLLRNVLRAAAACTVWATQLPKALRSVFSILTWKHAWRHSRVRVFNSATSKSVPMLKCFVAFWLRQSRALFGRIPPNGSAPAALERLSGAAKPGKNSMCRDCSNFGGILIYFNILSTYLSSLTLPKTVAASVLNRKFDF